MEDVATTGNLRVASLRALQPPSCVFEELPGDMSVYSLVLDTRQAVANILLGADDRLLVVVGLGRGNSDAEAFNLLAEALSGMCESLRAELVLTISADATMNIDPTADSSFHINRGINQSREHVLELNRKGLPTALEFRDTITPQFFADLLSWASVSAESEALQELVSGLSMPVGVRAPATEPDAAMRAIETSAGPHHFLGVSAEGVCGVVKSTGNPDVIAVIGAAHADGGASSNSLNDALNSVHLKRPSASLMVEIGPDPLTDCATIEESTAQIGSKIVCCEGSLGGKIMGMHLRVHAANATVSSLSTMLNKLATHTQYRRKKRAALRRPSSSAAGTETDNLRIADVRPLLPPACLLEELPRDNTQAQVVLEARAAIGEIFSGASDRMLILAGPAVVDDVSAALEYGARLAALAREVSDDVLVVMTAEIFTAVSPSTGPWPGMLFDPIKDGSYQINKGVRTSREMLLQLSRLGLPTALQFRETITPQYFADLLSFAMVNAQSETLAELVSGLSMPAGLYAMRDAGSDDDTTKLRQVTAAAGEARHFLGVTAHGLAGIVESTGNSDATVVLSGGQGKPNERAGRILAACPAEGVASSGVLAACADQADLVKAIGSAVASGKPAPHGVAINSYLLAGAQAKGRRTGEDFKAIRGLSVTEPCMDWLATETVIRELAAAVRERRKVLGKPARPAKRARSEWP